MTDTSDRRFRRHELANSAQLADTRWDFSAWLSSLCAETERVEELLVVVSELGANAVEASPSGGPPATIEAWLSRNELAIEVVNQVGSTPDGSSWDLDDPLRTGGRGLMLVSAFTDDVEVEAEGETVRVRCVAELPVSDAS